MQQVLSNVFVAFSEMKELNKRKRTAFIAGIAPQKSKKRTNSAMFRRVSFTRRAHHSIIQTLYALLLIVNVDLF